MVQFIMTNKGCREKERLAKTIGEDGIWIVQVFYNQRQAHLNSDGDVFLNAA